MLCVICISRGGSASVSFSEVEERSVDLRHMAAVATQREPTCDVRSSEWWLKCRNLMTRRHVSAPIR